LVVLLAWRRGLVLRLVFEGVLWRGLQTF
jgi:hypothetical protein